MRNNPDSPTHYNLFLKYMDDSASLYNVAKDDPMMNVVALANGYATFMLAKVNLSDAGYDLDDPQFAGSIVNNEALWNEAVEALSFYFNESAKDMMTFANKKEVDEAGIISSLEEDARELKA
jgi:hypothetical protein